jgi:threonine dehydratase
MEDLKQYPVSLNEIIRAVGHVRPHLGPTALHHYPGLSRLIGAEVFVKHENHLPTGTFKIRGGINLMTYLAARGAPGVMTFSTGNHGLSTAWAARSLGLPAVVVVPEGANPVKTRAIVDAGADLVEAGATFEEAAARMEALEDELGFYVAHPADEPLLINGVGTEFVEILETLPDIDVMIVPVGAGSEAAAAVTALKTVRPSVQVVGVQAQASPAARQAWRTGRMTQADNQTFAGGFATGRTYRTPFEIYSRGLDDFVLLTEDEIRDGTALALHHTRNLAEGAGAASIMAAFKIRDRLAGRKVVLQMSGANASPEEIQDALRRPAFSAGRPAD